jgi:hypothetical protein
MLADAKVLARGCRTLRRIGFSFRVDGKVFDCEVASKKRRSDDVDDDDDGGGGGGGDESFEVVGRWSTVKRRKGN